MEDDFELIYSPLQQNVEHEDETYVINIFRGTDESGWQLEIVLPDGSSLVWDDSFDEDKEALAEALRAIHEEDLQEEPIDPAEAASSLSHSLNQALDTPLNDEEIELLNDFLLYRIPEEEIQENDDEGIINISELDGFLTAIVCAPDAIPPSKWMPSIWGKFEPDWESIEDSQAIMSQFLRHMNSISASLNDSSELFEPLLQELTSGDQIGIVVDEWCIGFIKGMRLCPSPWLTENESINQAIQRIIMFGDEDAPDYLVQYTAAEAEEMADFIPGAIESIYHHYYEIRLSTVPSTLDTYSRETPKVGRNDPCPCGSGKKFKKCCLH